MPPTATLEAIKAHQSKVEKDKITPDNLPPCPRCSVESQFFKILILGFEKPEIKGKKG